jgi:hypothetical protein
VTSSHLNLLFLRLAGLLAQGFLLVASAVLFAFGLLELYTALAILAFALACVTRLAASRARALYEHAERELGKAVDARGRAIEHKGTAGITGPAYARLSAFLTRFRVRRALGLPRDRFDTVQLVVSTLVWLSFLTFFASVSAGV